MVRLSRRRITIEEKGGQVVLRGWKVAELAREAGAKPLFVGSVSGWMIDAARLPDLMAVLDRRGIGVATDEGVRTAYPPVEKGVQVPHTPEEAKPGEAVFQSSLWDPTNGGDAA